MAEILDVVNERDEVVGRRPRDEVHRLGLMHRAVHVLVFNSRGQIFLQKRSMKKDRQPGLWDSSASGHVDSGEDYDACAVREVREEIGLQLNAVPQRLFKLTASAETDQEHVWVYRCASEGPFTLNEDEIERGGWFGSVEVTRWMADRPGDFASALPLIWSRLKLNQGWTRSEQRLDPVKSRVMIALALTILATVLFLAFIQRSSQTAGPPPPIPLPRVALIGPPRVQPQIVGGWGNIVVLAPDGSLWGWGDLGQGVLGFNSTNLITTPRRIGTESDWKAVASGWHFIIGLKTNGTLWLWGAFKSNWTGPSAAEAAPVQFTSDTNWISVSGRSAHVVALKSDGTVWTWGANNYGQLGDGTTKSRQTPLQLPGANWTAISAGSFHSVGLQRDGTLWVWGDDPLAVGHFPTRVGSESNWMSLFAGEFHTVAAKNDGTTWVWGKSAANFMSVPIVNRLIPVQGAQPWSAVAAGNAHNLGLNNDGSLWAWGLNSVGELGDGTNIRTATPVQIGQRTEWAAIGASGNMSAGLTADGCLWSWGIRLDQPPTIRVNRKVKLISQLLIPLGVNPGSTQEKIYVRSAQPELIFKFNEDSTNAASKSTE